ncbi:hypothetical protein [Propionibacterium acidifaciens]|uniref:hypothetical protein n=1 Tax=Propionibacterium acidifaciens TaxID=556499 RepID=UPI0028E6CEF8|nr:hypothetical protein [Propionibacterium acidifaciens]
MVTVELAHSALIARSADGTEQSVLALHGFNTLRDVRRWMQQLGVYDRDVYSQAAALVAARAGGLIRAGRA